MIISLHGSYFRDNYGDILLMEIFTKWVKETYPDAQINYPKLDDKKISGLKSDYTTSMWKLLKSDALVFFGGGYFGEQPRKKTYWSIRNYFRHIVIGNLAILFKIPYVIIGVEFGPISKNWFKRCVMRLVRHAQYVVARNEQSVDFLHANGYANVLSSMDAVLTLQKQTTDSEDKNVLLHLPGAYSDITKFEAIVNMLLPILKDNNIDKVFFIEDDRSQYAHNDYEKIFALFNNAHIQYSIHEYKGTSNLVDFISKGSHIITTKLHVGITALALNKRVFSIYHHPKTIRLHTQVGNAHNCLSLKEFDHSAAQKFASFFKSDKYELPDECRMEASYNKEILQRFLTNL